MEAGEHPGHTLFICNTFLKFRNGLASNLVCIYVEPLFIEVLCLKSAITPCSRNSLPWEHSLIHRSRQTQTFLLAHHSENRERGGVNSEEQPKAVSPRFVGTREFRGDFPVAPSLPSAFTSWR